MQNVFSGGGPNRRVEVRRHSQLSPDGLCSLGEVTKPLWAIISELELEKVSSSKNP